GERGPRRDHQRQVEAVEDRDPGEHERDVPRRGGGVEQLPSREVLEQEEGDQSGVAAPPETPRRAHGYILPQPRRRSRCRKRTPATTPTTPQSPRTSRSWPPTPAPAVRGSKTTWRAFASALIGKIPAIRSSHPGMPPKSPQTPETNVRG